MEWFIREVLEKHLREFVEMVQEHDCMGGNKIQSIERHGENYKVVFTREYSYPFIINQLDDWLNGPE